MTDWTKSTGSSGTMMIRDTGTYVEFWLKAASSTFNYDLPWRYRINNSTSSWREFSFQPSGDWQRLGRWNITYDQEVVFYLGDSNTNGLGGPTTFSHDIARATVPPKPGPFEIISVSNTSVYGDADGNGNGGATVDRWQVGYGTSSSSPQSYKDTSGNGTATITGLTPGRRYYFWFRGHNAKGWSAWSNRTYADTHDVPEKAINLTLTEPTQTTFQSRFSSGGDGGSKILENQTGYGTDPNTPQSFVNTYQPLLTNLEPYTTYYVWGRQRNEYGWGPWSDRASIKTLAGAWVKVGNAWKPAIPYVKHDGVWKVAQPWARIGGLWKETQ